MIRIISILIAFAILTVLFMAPVSSAGGPGSGRHSLQNPALDYTLMGFKDQGAWYFPCVAPEFPVRIGPHYQTYGPPPPPCCAGHCAPVGPPPAIKK